MVSYLAWWWLSKGPQAQKACTDDAQCRHTFRKDGIIRIPNDTFATLNSWRHYQVRPELLSITME